MLMVFFLTTYMYLLSISSSFQVNISVENVGMVMNNLTDIVIMINETSDQNDQNIEIISSVVIQTASLLALPAIEQAVEPEVIEMVSYHLLTCMFPLLVYF